MEIPKCRQPWASRSSNELLCIISSKMDYCCSPSGKTSITVAWPSRSKEIRHGGKLVLIGLAIKKKKKKNLQINTPCHIRSHPFGYIDTEASGGICHIVKKRQTCPSDAEKFPHRSSGRPSRRCRPKQSRCLWRSPVSPPSSSGAPKRVPAVDYGCSCQMAMNTAIGDKEP